MTNKTYDERDKIRQQQIAQRQKKLYLFRTAIAVSVVLIITICSIIIGVTTHQAKKETKEKNNHLVLSQTRRALENVRNENTLSFLAVGDNLYEDNIIKSGQSAASSISIGATDTSDTWNYDFIYDNIRSDISLADLASIDQVCPITTVHSQAAGYQELYAPSEAASSVVNAGFDIVQQASDHAYDQGSAGILSTIDFWKNSYPQITYLGIHDSLQDSESVKIVEKKGFKIGLLNYTYGISSGTLPSGNKYMIDILAETSVRTMVAKAKEQSDFVIFFLHAGTEDQTTPDETVQTWVNLLLDLGVDVIIGGHPHVISTYEMLTREDGHRTLVYYSLGNFVSDQKKVLELLGGMAEFTLKKDWLTGEISITSYTMIPTVMHYNHTRSEYSIYKLSDYNDTLASEHSIHDYTDDVFTVESLQKAFNAIVTSKFDRLINYDSISEETPDDAAVTVSPDSQQSETSSPNILLDNPFAMNLIHGRR